MLASEFERLGEVLTMTKLPLRLVLGAATDIPRSLSDEGLANFIIGSAKLYSRDVELTDPKDRKLAQLFLFHGEWAVEGPFALMDGDEIAGVEFVAKPVEPTNQGWEGIGTASRIFSSFYADQIIDGEPTPNWLTPLASWDFKNSKLSLLLGRIQPSGTAYSGSGDHKVL